MGSVRILSSVTDVRRLPYAVLPLPLYRRSRATTRIHQVPARTTPVTALESTDPVTYRVCPDGRRRPPPPRR